MRKKENMNYSKTYNMVFDSLCEIISKTFLLILEISYLFFSYFLFLDSVYRFMADSVVSVILLVAVFFLCGFIGITSLAYGFVLIEKKFRKSCRAHITKKRKKTD